MTYAQAQDAMQRGRAVAHSDGRTVYITSLFAVPMGPGRLRAEVGVMEPQSIEEEVVGLHQIEYTSSV